MWLPGGCPSSNGKGHVFYSDMALNFRVALRSCKLQHKVGGSSHILSPNSEIRRRVETNPLSCCASEVLGVFPVLTVRKLSPMKLVAGGGGG